MSILSLITFFVGAFITFLGLLCGLNYWWVGLIIMGAVLVICFTDLLVRKIRRGE